MNQTILFVEILAFKRYRIQSYRIRVHRRYSAGCPEDFLQPCLLRHNNRPQNLFQNPYEEDLDCPSKAERKDDHRPTVSPNARPNHGLTFTCSYYFLASPQWAN